MSEHTNNTNMFMDWDDAIENDGQEFVILDEGDYNFTVTGFERGHFPGSAKIPPCNKAVLTLSVDTPDGVAVTKFDLIMYRTLEWRVSSFFRCIGHKKHGERLVMDWSKVVGSKGWARFKPRTYTDKNGDERQTNDVGSFYDYDPAFFPEKQDWVKEAENAENASWEQGTF